MLNNEIDNLVESKREKFIKVNDLIWDFAEIRYEEYKSSKLQIDILKEEGFEVEIGIGDIPTAFVGSYGEGEPVIALLGEFDALEELSQEENNSEKIPVVKGGNGHGCGHNTLGTAMLSSATAVKDYMTKHNLKGTIKYFGCPAEEGGSGKTFMVRDGCFNNVDLALTWHPLYLNTVLDSGCLSNVRVSFNFKGISSHAAATPHLGRSALDAVELMNVGVNYLREHIIPEARVHYAITNAGGNSPNVVQGEAEVYYAIRAPYPNQVNEIYNRILNVAKGAALMTETTVEANLTSGYSNFNANKTLTDLLKKNMKETLPIDYTEEEYEYAQKFRNTLNNDNYTNYETAFTTNGDKKLKAMIKGVYEKPIFDIMYPSINMTGSTDVGDVSWNVPTAQCSIACYANSTPPHSWQLVAQGKSSIAHKGMLTVSKIVAKTAVEVLSNGKLVELIKKDFEQELNGEKYICPVPKGVLPKIKKDREA